MSKDKDYIRLIHSPRWLNLRAAVLTRHPLCRTCEEKGRLRAATEVHHVVPAETALTHRDMERLMFDPANLRPLCHACHVEAHKALGRSGLEQTRKRNASRLERWKARFLS